MNINEQYELIGNVIIIFLLLIPIILSVYNTTLNLSKQEKEILSILNRILKEQHEYQTNLSYYQQSSAWIKDHDEFYKMTFENSQLELVITNTITKYDNGDCQSRLEIRLIAYNPRIMLFNYKSNKGDKQMSFLFRSEYRKIFHPIMKTIKDQYLQKKYIQQQEQNEQYNQSLQRTKISLCNSPNPDKKYGKLTLVK